MPKSWDWGTPFWLFDRLNAEFGPFDLDAAASDWNAKCPRYYTERDDATAIKDWDGERIWLNPPYGSPVIDNFITMAFRQSIYDKRVVLLLPCRTETAWWHEAVLPYAKRVLFVRGRVAFIPHPEKKLSPRGNRPVFNSVVVVFGGPYGDPVMGSILAPRNAKEHLLQTELPLEGIKN